MLSKWRNRRAAALQTIILSSYAMVAGSAQQLVGEFGCKTNKQIILSSRFPSHSKSGGFYYLCYENALKLQNEAKTENQHGIRSVLLFILNRCVACSLLGLVCLHGCSC